MQSLNRLLRILEEVAASKHAPSAVDVAESVGLSLSTVSRLMHVLADEGLLDRAGRDRRYTLGPRLFALAHAATQIDLTTIARPFLESLRDVTGETASLHVLRGRQRVCLVEVPSHHPVRRVVPVGLPASLAGSATGAVLLAACSEDRQVEQVDAFRMSAAERSMFEGCIEHARTHGWALVVDEWVPGLTGLSVAVAGGDANIAAISVSGPSARFTKDVALSHLDDVLSAADSISARMVGGPRDASSPDQTASVPNV